MFDKLKNFFKSDPNMSPQGPTPPIPLPEKKVRAKRGPMPPKVIPSLTPKQQASMNNEPYIDIISVDIDPANINNGQFEFDWNDKFILNLIKAGYKTREDDTDAMMVDRWFHTVCRNVVLELYEQEQADPLNRDPITDERIIQRKPLGEGRSEIS
jgi:hypothetical protein